MVSQDSLIERTKDWLNKQGYPLEMRVAQAFAERGFNIFQSESYLDPESNKFREIDVVASAQIDYKDILVRVKFVIECKSSNNKPWIIFTSESHTFHQNILISHRFATSLGDELLHQIRMRNDFQQLAFFQNKLAFGYSITQAFTNGSDEAYSALMSAAKSAYAESIAAETGSKTQGPVCEIIIPIIVIDAKLLEASLDDRGYVTLIHKNTSTIIWRNPISGFPNTIVHIYTNEALEFLLDDCNELVRTILFNTNSELETLQNSLPADAPRWRRF